MSLHDEIYFDMNSPRFQILEAMEWAYTLDADKPPELDRKNLIYSKGPIDLDIDEWTKTMIMILAYAQSQETEDQGVSPFSTKMIKFRYAYMQSGIESASKHEQNFNNPQDFAKMLVLVSIKYMHISNVLNGVEDDRFTEEEKQEILDNEDYCVNKLFVHMWETLMFNGAMFVDARKYYRK